MSARRAVGPQATPRTTALRRRASKVRRGDLARPVKAGASFASWLSALPGILAARDLRALAAEIVAARRGGREVLLGIGAHVIKCGLSPWVVALMEERLITGVAMNGAGRHARLERRADGWVVVDLDSTNFTRVNGERVRRERVLAHGDELRLGRAVCRFLSRPA